MELGAGLWAERLANPHPSLRSGWGTRKDCPRRFAPRDDKGERWSWERGCGLSAWQIPTLRCAQDGAPGRIVHVALLLGMTRERDGAGSGVVGWALGKSPPFAALRMGHP